VYDKVNLTAKIEKNRFTQINEKVELIRFNTDERVRTAAENYKNVKDKRIDWLKAEKQRA